MEYVDDCGLYKYQYPKCMHCETKMNDIFQFYLCSMKTKRKDIEYNNNDLMNEMNGEKRKQYSKIPNEDTPITVATN